MQVCLPDHDPTDEYEGLTWQTDHPRGRCRVVAGMRYLAEQGRCLLHGADPTRSNVRCASHPFHFAVATRNRLPIVPAFGIVGARQADIGPLTSIYLMYGGSGFTDVAAALSLITNLLATSLIAFKAWYAIYVVLWSIIFEIACYSFHRRRLKSYLDTSGAKTRVLKVLGLFIESGSVYCVILVSETVCAMYAVWGHIAYIFTASGPHLPAQLRNLEHPRPRRVLFHVRMSRAHRGKWLLQFNTRSGRMLIPAS